MKRTKEDIEHSITRLKRLKPGQTIYTILRHRSTSGMSRIIDMVVVENGEIESIGLDAANIMERSFVNDKYYGIKVGGCGMDMGFSLVYDLGYCLFRGGVECIGKKCLSNDHTNGDRNYKKHIHKDGGYAFKHRWL